MSREDQTSQKFRRTRRLLLRPCLDEILRHIADEWNRARRDTDVATKDCLEVVRRSVIQRRIILILAYARSVQVNAGKDSLGARVAQKLRAQFPIC